MTGDTTSSMTPNGISYLKGPANQPLLRETIGQCLDRITAGHPDHEALVVRHQGIRWTYAEYLHEINRLATGLLLPIWKRLPNESTRVYRLQTDAGERIIGRRVSPAWAANAVTTGAASLTPEQAFSALMGGTAILDLADGLQLRRARVMNAQRLELTGFTEAMRGRMRAYGLFSEIISWKLRFFVPVDDTGPAILAKLLDTFPVARISEREAA